MPRRVTLVALWVVFAVASVSVGFAAAGLVSDPFTDAGASTDLSTLAGPGDEPVTEPGAAPSGQATGTATPSTSPRTVAGTPTQTPSGAHPTRSSHPTSTSTASASTSTIKSGITTRGGYVSATCQGGLVSVGAAPAVYWWVGSHTPGWVRTARVRLERTHEGHNERVDVTATCAGGAPSLTADYRKSGGDSGDDGGGDTGGSGDTGSSGGGSDSSDSGSG